MHWWNPCLTGTGWSYIAYIISNNQEFISWRKSYENKSRYVAIIIHRRNLRKLDENSHMIFVLANISSLVNILELLEKCLFGIVVDNVDNIVLKKGFSMEECQQMWTAVTAYRKPLPVLFQINIRKKRRGNQRNWQQWVHKTHDEDNQNKK